MPHGIPNLRSPAFAAAAAAQRSSPLSHALLLTGMDVASPRSRPATPRDQQQQASAVAQHPQQQQQHEGQKGSTLSVGPNPKTPQHTASRHATAAAAQEEEEHHTPPGNRLPAGGEIGTLARGASVATSSPPGTGSSGRSDGSQVSVRSAGGQLDARPVRAADLSVGERDQVKVLSSPVVITTSSSSGKPKSPEVVSSRGKLREARRSSPQKSIMDLSGKNLEQHGRTIHVCRWCVCAPCARLVHVYVVGGCGERRVFACVVGYIGKQGCVCPQGGCLGVCVGCA